MVPDILVHLWLNIFEARISQFHRSDF